MGEVQRGVRGLETRAPMLGSVCLLVTRGNTISGSLRHWGRRKTCRGHCGQEAPRTAGQLHTHRESTRRTGHAQALRALQGHAEGLRGHSSTMMMTTKT